MFDFFTRGGVAFYLVQKLSWSWANDVAVWWAPRKALPLFRSPSEAWDYWRGKGAPYTGDPLGGAGDFYTHPHRVQAALEAGTAQRLSIDCDDCALWAHFATRSMPGCQSRMLTIVDASGKFGHHVICVGTYNGQAWAIDTNGYRALSDLSEAPICRIWTDIYASLGYRYTMAVETPSPW